MIDYCRVFNLTTTELLDFIFDPGVISLTISHSEPDQNGEYSITRYNIVVRSTIPLNLLDSSFDKYTVTSIEVDMEGSTFTLRQVCYDARNEDEAAMANVLFDKSFELDRDGRLRSPNYTISSELFEEDLEHYRLMIAQLMIFMGGLLHSTLQTVSLEPNQP